MTKLIKKHKASYHVHKRSLTSSSVQPVASLPFVLDALTFFITPICLAFLSHRFVNNLKKETQKKNAKVRVEQTVIT